MRIMIDFDPTMGTAKVTSPAYAEIEAVTQAASQPVAQSAALDAGAYLGMVPGERPSATLLLPIISAGVATAPSSALPTPHRDTFVLLSDVSRSEEGLNAGTPKV